jgi:hypothetical protein
VLPSGALAYVYGHTDPRDAGIAKALTLDEARKHGPTVLGMQQLI